jgi:glycosyltransferase involved in cell wall biosynthesis
MSSHPPIDTKDNIQLLKRIYRPLVSIIVPIFNIRRLDWFQETLRSLVYQTWTDFEIILVDDASYDSSTPVILKNFDRYLSKNHWIMSPYVLAELFGWRFRNTDNFSIPFRIIRHKINMGLPGARNSGVAFSRGSFVMFLDPDDGLDPQAIEKMVLVALPSISTHQGNNKFGFVYSGVYHFSSDPNSQFHIPVAIFADYDPHRFKRENFLASTALISRQVYMKIGGMCTRNHLNYYEDYEFWCRLASFGFHGVGIVDPLFWYRRHGEGQSESLLRKAKKFTRNGESAESVFLREIEYHCPVVFGRMSRGEIETFMKARRGETIINNSYLLRLANNESFLPCYRSWKQEQSSTPVNPELLIDTEMSQDAVMYIIPWTVIGGADLYDLEILRFLRSKKKRVTLVLDRHIPQSMMTLYSNFSNVAHEMFNLQRMSNDSLVQDFILDYLMVSRGVSLVIMRASISGYRWAARYLNHRCNSNDISCRKLDGMNKVLKHFLPSERIANFMKKVKAVDILHLYSVNDRTNWEWRSGKVACALDARMVISQDLARFMNENVRHGQDSNVDVLGMNQYRKGFDMCTNNLTHDPSRIHIIPPPANFDNLALEHSEGSEALPHTLLFFGRLDTQKDPILWLRTAEHLSEMFQFEMFGDGELRGTVEDLARRHLYTKIKIHASLPHHALGEKLLSNLNSILLVTSQYDGISMIILEALALGIPVVALDCTSWTGGGLREVSNLMIAHDEAFPLFDLVEPIPNSNPQQEASDGRLCPLDETEVSKLLARRILFMQQKIQEHNDRIDAATLDSKEPKAVLGWRSRMTSMKCIRDHYGLKAFRNRIQALLDSLHQQ